MQSNRWRMHVEANEEFPQAGTEKFGIIRVEIVICWGFF